MSKKRSADMKTALDAMQIGETARLATAAFDAMQIGETARLASATFDALKVMKNSPFNENYSKIISGIEIKHESKWDLDDPSLKMDQEVQASNDFNELSEKTKTFLLYLFHTYLLAIMIAIFVAQYLADQEGVKKELQNKLQAVSTPSEVRSFVRASRISFDRSILKGFRVTSADNLRFREGASMQSNVITTLPVGSLVEVIDKTNRSWLFVEVEIDGILEQGWISRRYTSYFR